MTEKETIEKYKIDIIENENSIYELKKMRPFGIAAVILFPFLIPIIPLRGKKMTEVFPYEISLIICFILFSLMYISIYYNTISKKERQIKRLKIWISQIEKGNI
ncbi:hypothetical protein [Flavobacterium sp.]|jgi:hypothetical protein|uniref:hypothetical protein n=1 Tax=Flavobacterium sp. TaxID=239 RepID=UPI0037BEF215